MMLGSTSQIRSNSSLRAVKHIFRYSLTAGKRLSNGTAARWIRNAPHTIARNISSTRSVLNTNKYDPLSNPKPPRQESDLPFYRRIVSAWTNTPTKWYPLPIAVGALLLVAIQYRKQRARRVESELDSNGQPRDIIRLKGPWQVHVIGALPLRNLSRLWGYLNSLELPIWFRPIGFTIYGVIFGCNFDEMEEPDLKAYASLGDFFYRTLKPGVRPVDQTAAIVSPADGKILHFGTIQENGRVEQVKGISYSLDALLGFFSDDNMNKNVTRVDPILNTDHSTVDHHDFANVNGIEYSLEQLLGSSNPPSGANTPTTEKSEPLSPPKKHGRSEDASVEQKDALARETTVASEMGVRSSMIPSHGHSPRPGNELFFAVVYLAPGDYHRFHSPTAWVVEKRRHFVGELYSVSPYMAKRLENLFVLNERVALLGRWKHGFFSMVPVGATNVGSILINFDQALRTNIRGKRPPPGAYTEAVYSEASTILGGQPLTKAQEMGGFKLGSTIVLVFEAPKEFEFSVKAGQLIKVGEKMGDVVS